MRALRFLIARRQRRGGSLYSACLILYVLYALSYADEASFHQGTHLLALWYLAVPLAVIVAQLIYPTVLGWASVLGGFGFYFLTATYFCLRNFGWEQWRVDTSGFVLGLVLLIVLGSVCVGLYRLRPPAPVGGRVVDR